MRDDELRAELIDFADWMLDPPDYAETVVDAYINARKADGEW